MMTSPHLLPLPSPSFSPFFGNPWICYCYFLLLALKISESFKKDWKPRQSSWEQLSCISLPSLFHETSDHFKIDNENLDLWYLLQFTSPSVYRQQVRNLTTLWDSSFHCGVVLTADCLQPFEAIVFLHTNSSNILMGSIVSLQSYVFFA